MVTTAQKLVIKRSQQSVTWFLKSFGKLKHSSAGVLPFNPFNYQKTALQAFRQNRFCVFKKCRQAGVSKIAGAFALWFAMFHAQKTILIVSRKNDDAMSFLRENIIFIFERLPEWMQKLWEPVKQNEHEIVLPNGSSIKSLTSHPDVLRSHTSSLNIIDEAAFIPQMGEMWAAGYPTLQHGGSVIVVSTTSGIGNWYWSTWTDAEAGLNQFHPIVINWWDMDWVIEYDDPLSREHKRIAPRDGIRKCITKEEIEKYGPFWSPWLEEQWRGLQERGEGWKFEQEVLASFVGSGNTVLTKSVIAHISTTIDDEFTKITGVQVYVNPVTGDTDDIDFDFSEPEEGLWIWKEPVVATPDKIRGGEIIEKGTIAHSYAMGIDTATGKGRDYHGIEILDVNTMEQVAELMMRCLPRELIKFIDRVGRWYNCALAVVERNNGGDTIIDELRYGVMYPRLWRRKDINDKPRNMKSKTQRPMKVAHYGYMTSAGSKPALNKFLVDCVRDNSEDGYTIYSRRLLKQIQTYVRKRDRTGRDTGKTEAEEGAGNHDDLVMSLGLALIGASDAYITDAANLMPVGSNTNFKSQTGPTLLTDAQQLAAQMNYVNSGGANMLMPMTLSSTEMPDMSAQRAIDNYTLQLGAIPMNQGKPVIVPKDYFYRRDKS